jgi:hypothetical protein
LVEAAFVRSDGDHTLVGWNVIAVMTVRSSKGAISESALRHFAIGR